MLNLTIYQQIMATNPRFGLPVLPPVNLLEFALDLQVRTIRVVSRQLALQVKDYTDYDKDELERNKYTHLAHLMRICQSLSRLCTAVGIPLQECEDYRSTHFVQQRYSGDDEKRIPPSYSQEQRIWYPLTRHLLGESNTIAHSILLDYRKPNELNLTESIRENLGLLWTCLYERIEDLGFPVENCLKRTILGEFIEKFGYNTIRPKKTVYDHYVVFDMTDVGERSLSLFIERVPKNWGADFYELFRDDPGGVLILQYFRTPTPIDPFIATPLARDLPGSVDWDWNSPQAVAQDDNND